MIYRVAIAILAGLTAGAALAQTTPPSGDENKTDDQLRHDGSCDLGARRGQNQYLDGDRKQRHRARSRRHQFGRPYRAKRRQADGSPQGLPAGCQGQVWITSRHAIRQCLFDDDARGGPARRALADRGPDLAGDTRYNASHERRPARSRRSGRPSSEVAGSAYRAESRRETECRAAPPPAARRHGRRSA